MQRATQGLARRSLADPSNQVATRGKSFTFPFLRQLDLSWTQAGPLLFPSVAPRPSPHLAGRQSSGVRYCVPVHAPTVASRAADATVWGYRRHHAGAAVQYCSSRL